MGGVTGVGYGLVEGFYGSPWSLEARRRLIRTLGELGLSTYAYAPKSDPYHRARWWEPLPASELRAFATLADEARQAGVRFVYGIAPQRLFGGRANLRAHRTSEQAEARIEKLHRRCASVASLGVRDFMVLFDDTWATLLPRFSSFDGGLAHGRVARALQDRLSAEYEDVSISIVPAIYSGRASELQGGAPAYLRGIAAAGPFPIAWTGPRIFSPYISSRELEAFRAAASAPIWIWSNAIANDWLPLSTGEALGLPGRQRLAFGPTDNLGPGVVTRSAGVLLNGAREPVVTEVALATLAEQIRAPRASDSASTLRRAIERVYGEATPVILRLFTHVAGHPLAAPHVRGASHIDDLLEVSRRDPAARLALDAELDRLENLEIDLRRALNADGRDPMPTGGGTAPIQHLGWAELAPTAAKISRVARALRAISKGDPRSRALANEAESIHWATDLDALLRLAKRRRG